MEKGAAYTRVNTVKGEESTTVKTLPMEECVDEEEQAEITSAVETPQWRNLLIKRENNMVQKNSQKELTRKILAFKQRNMKTLHFQLHPANHFPHCQFLCIILWSNHFDMQGGNFLPPVIPYLHLLRCVNIFLRQRTKTMSMALKKVCKGRKGRKDRMRRTREDKRCFLGVMRSKAAKMSCVQISQQNKEMLSVNKSQAFYLYILDMTGMLNDVELAYKAKQLT